MTATLRPASGVRSELALAPDSGGRGLDLVVEMAHDLKSPLTSILILAEAMRGGRAGPVTEDQRRQLGLIYSAALKLCTTASDVVEFARGGRQLVEAVPRPFGVSDVLHSVRDMVLPMAEEKGLHLVVTPPEADCRLGHPRALSRVLLNLATNALKFTEHGFVEIAARDAEDGSGRLEFSVTDTGPGIGAETVRSLFRPFDAAHEVRHHCGGTGLGLVICRKLVAAMGSELRFETRLEYGTRFYFTLDVPPVASAA